MDISKTPPKLRWSTPASNDSVMREEWTLKETMTDKARAIAKRLTYNEDTPQAAAKHMLMEMAAKLDAQDIKAHKKKDGLLLINGLGRTRYATFRERILYRLFGVVPPRV